MKGLRKNLRTLLEAAHLSENELARRTGVPQQIINRLLQGQNKNPTIATLLPLAQYFMVSISQLIGEDILHTEPPTLDEAHLGWKKVPLIAWEEAGQVGKKNKSGASEKFVLVDAPVSEAAFSVKMKDDSMRLKFEKGALLIFDPTKKPKHKDFVLFTTQGHVYFKQFFLKGKEAYVKCLNPKLACYKMTLLKEALGCLGVLVQSRVDYFNEE